MPFQLCFAEQSLSEVLDEIAADANAVAPGLSRERARELLERIFRARVTQTDACGMSRECRPQAPVWGGVRLPTATEHRPCAFHDGDPYDLPNVFAVAAADLIAYDTEERDAAEARLADVFRMGLGKRVFLNNRCGRTAVCNAPPTDPFVLRRSR
jgi:hypothetical protein